MYLKPVLILILLSSHYNTFSQKKYYQNKEGSLFDSIEYAHKKQIFLKNSTDSLGKTDLFIRLNEHLIKKRATADSIIFSFQWEIILASPASNKPLSLNYRWVFRKSNDKILGFKDIYFKFFTADIHKIPFIEFGLYYSLKNIYFCNV
ncbi:MAG: hypothetical protein ORN85_08390 [Sediminibacterium sp.]|nr:hypothetical protein [Sediminibacterium sp.]